MWAAKASPEAKVWQGHTLIDWHDIRLGWQPL